MVVFWWVVVLLLLIFAGGCGSWRVCSHTGGVEGLGFSMVRVVQVAGITLQLLPLPSAQQVRPR